MGQRPDGTGGTSRGGNLDPPKGTFQGLRHLRALLSPLLFPPSFHEGMKETRSDETGFRVNLLDATA